jgi:hypothetical protein
MFLLKRGSASIREHRSMGKAQLEVELFFSVGGTIAEASMPSSYRGLNLDGAVITKESAMKTSTPKDSPNDPKTTKNIKDLIEDVSDFQLTLFLSPGPFAQCFAESMTSIVKLVHHVPLLSSGSFTVPAQQLAKILKSDVFIFHHKNLDALFQSAKEYRRITSDKAAGDRKPIFVFVTAADCITTIRQYIHELHLPIRRVIILTKPMSDFKYLLMLRLSLHLKDSLFKVKSKTEDNSSSDENWDGISKSKAPSARLLTTHSPSTMDSLNTESSRLSLTTTPKLKDSGKAT